MTTGGSDDTDWYAIYRALIHGKPRLKPWEIERLTPAELLICLDQNIEEKRPPLGASQMDTAAYAKWWRSLTCWDRVQRAAEKRESL